MSEVSTWNFSFDEAAKACCLSTEDLLAIEGKKVIGCAEWQRIGNRIQVGIGGGVWTIDAADLVHNAVAQRAPASGRSGAAESSTSQSKGEG